MIRDRLMEINQETWNSDKIDQQEQFVREFAIGFAEWCLRSGLYHQMIRTQKIDRELLKIYENGDRE